jgi:fructuronate reductase
MLNGAHSALAYLGIRQGYDFVHEAIADAAIRPVIIRLMREEAAPTVAPGVDTVAYADMLLARFANTGLPHQLRQIAMDGSQKIPQRWLGTLADQQREGGRCTAILEALAAWMLHVRGDFGPVDDPWADRLAGMWREAGTDGIADRLFGKKGMFAKHWRAGAEDIAFLTCRLQDPQT